MQLGVLNLGLLCTPKFCTLPSLLQGIRALLRCVSEMLLARW